MSMYPQPIAPIPAETRQLAWRVNPKGTLIMRVRDRLGSLYQDEDFVGLYPTTGQPAFAPWRLALIIVFEYLEGLTDRQAAEAVRNRIDWKYALSQELDDAGWDASVSRLVAGKTGTDRLARGLDSFHQQSAHRFDAYSGESASAQPTGSGRRNAARGVGCPQPRRRLLGP